MDTLKAKLTIAAALKFFELLTQAIDRGENRAIGAALANLGRELQALKRLIDNPNDD